VRLVYLGAEVPSNRKLLLDSGVKLVGFSYMRAFKRGFPKTKKFNLRDYFPADVGIILHPGTQEIDHDLEADYHDFVVANLDQSLAFVDWPSPRPDRAWAEELGEQYWPVWQPSEGYAALHDMAARFPEIAITGDTIDSDTRLAAQARALSSQYGTVWHALAVSRPDNLRQVPVTTASTLSWASPMMRGETIVWDGISLKRYPKKMKDQARPRYKRVIEDAGLDYDAILADNAKEVSRLAIWSYQKLEEHMSKKEDRPNLRVVDENTPSEELVTHPHRDQEVVDMILGEVGNKGTEVEKPRMPLAAPREAQERRYLPVLGVSTRTSIEAGEDGNPVLREVPVLESKGTSLRQCDTCFVAANCPAYKPQSECAFSLPVEVKTKEQLVALLQAIIEMQGSRVAFARFAEELNGGYPDPNVSQEMDRLFKLVTQLKDLESSSESIRITMERKSGAGVLSAIFGDRASQLRELESGGFDQDQTTRIIQQSIEE
jgi:hypothetical protein